MGVGVLWETVTDRIGVQTSLQQLVRSSSLECLAVDSPAHT